MTSEDLDRVVAEAVKKGVAAALEDYANSDGNPYFIASKEHYDHHAHFRKCLAQCESRKKTLDFAETIHSGVEAMRSSLWKTLGTVFAAAIVVAFILLFSGRIPIK